MADNSNTIQLILQVKDDGTVVIDQASAKIKGLGDATGQASKKASGALDGLKNSYIELKAKIDLVVAAYGQVKKYTWDLSKEIGSLNNDVQRQADILGMSTNEYQKWVYAAKMSDVQSQDLSLSFKLLARNIEETARGTSTSTNYFALMGISLQDTSGRIRPFGDLMGDIADQFSRWEDGPKKIAIAMDLFGRSGEALIPILSKGRQGIQEYFKEAQNLGIILDESIIKKGSEVEDILKRIDAQNLANKMAMAPAALEFARFMGIMADGLGKLITEREKDSIRNWLIKDLPVWVKKAGETVRILKKDIYTWPDETRFKLPQIKIPPPEPTKWGEIISFSEMTQKAFEGLGISVDKTAESIRFDLDIIKTAYEKGTASGLTYVKALTAAQNALDKLKPKDDLKDRLKLEEEYQKKHNELMKMDPGPERRAEANKLTDWWLDEIKKLNAAKPPSIIDITKLEQDVKKAEAEAKKLYGSFDELIRPEMDTSKAIIQMDGIEYRYNALKNSIERNSIQIKIQQEGGGAGNLYSSNVGLVTGQFADQNLSVKLKYLGADGKEYSSLKEANSAGLSGASPIKWASDTEANVNFTATGLSPKIPLGDAFKKIIANFDTMEKKTSGMEATIKFAELSDQLSALQKKYDMYQSIIDQRVYQIGRYSTSSADPMQNWLVKEAREFQEGILSEMQVPKLKLAQQKYLLGFQGAEEEFYNLFQSQYGFPAYQRGTSYVPETGLALVHQGERITPANQNSFSFGAIKIDFHINGGGDPKRAADELAKVLKYELSGSLKEAIQKINK